MTQAPLSAGSREEPTAFTAWRALGMLIQLVVTDPGQLDAARDLLTEDLTELDLTCSRFRDDSELVALGDAAREATAPVTVTVSPLLAQAIAVALSAASVTDGDVDPTVGGVLCALGYDRDFGQVPATGPALPGGVGFRVIPGWRSIKLDPVTRRLTVPPGVQLDLGATVKGWAADLSAARIAEKLGCGVLVSLGGDTSVAGEPPDGGWRIRVQDVTGMPDQPSSGPSTVVAIRDGGLATSSTPPRCTTSWTRARACPRRLSGGRSRWPRPAAPTRTRPRPRRSSGAVRRRPGWPASACPHGSSSRTAPCLPSRAGRPTRSDYAASRSRSQSSAAAAVQD